MPGGTYLYRCDRCPLILELGGGTGWGDDGAIYLEEVQVACGACGTMHRLTERDGTCRLPEGTFDTGRLAILSDALLDAGCDDEALLQHLREPGPHVRGCHGIDLILGKE